MTAILAFLASAPTPQEIIAYQSSEALRERSHYLHDRLLVCITVVGIRVESGTTLETQHNHTPEKSTTPAAVSITASGREYRYLVGNLTGDSVRARAVT